MLSETALNSSDNVVNSTRVPHSAQYEGQGFSFH